jgi:Ca-activated chloride channel family protein
MGRVAHQSRKITAAALAAAFSVATLAAQAPVFRVESKLVRLIVSVKNSKGEIVGSLEQHDFKVFDTGVPQAIQYFEHHTELPLSVSILIDTSGSTAKELAYEIESVRKFLRALFREGNPRDAAALYAFNDEVTQLASFTRRQDRLDAALRRISARSGTSIYDAVYLAAREIEGRDGRHVMIVVSDGGDTTSIESFESARRAAQYSEITVYPILVLPITNDAGRNVGGENALKQLARDTGGRVFEPSGSKELDRAFAEILRDLRTQYLIGYRPANLPEDAPRFHPVRVEVSRPDLRVSTRSGYYSDTAGGR